MAFLVAQFVKNPPAMKETRFDSWVRKICWRRDRLPTSVFLGFPEAQLVKNPPPMRETSVQSLGWEDPLEKGTATHSSILAWRIPWTVESVGSQRVGHHWVTFISLQNVNRSYHWMVGLQENLYFMYFQTFKTGYVSLLLLCVWLTTVI